MSACSSECNRPLLDAGVVGDGDQSVLVDPGQAADMVQPVSFCIQTQTELSNYNTVKDLDIFSTNYLVQPIMLQEIKKQRNQDDTVSLKSNKVTSKNRTLSLYFVCRDDRCCWKRFNYCFRRTLRATSDIISPLDVVTLHCMYTATNRLTACPHLPPA